MSPLCLPFTSQNARKGKEILVSVIVVMSLEAWLPQDTTAYYHTQVVALLSYSVLFEFSLTYGSLETLVHPFSFLYSLHGTYKPGSAKEWMNHSLFFS